MLKKILGSIDYSKFFKEYWGKRHIVLDGDLKKEILFNKDKFFQIIDRNNLEFPRLTCMNNSGQCPLDQYADITPYNISSKIIAKNVRKLAEEGNTVRIRAVDQFDEGIETLKTQMIETFRFNTTINAYYSSSPANGINPHYDIRHIFILQLEGVKEWNMGNRINQVPRHDFRPFKQMEDYDVYETLNLNQGDILYIPPGMWHHTRTLLPNHSLHIAIGVTMVDWYDMIKTYTEYIMKKFPIFREHIPFKIEKEKLSYKQNIAQDIIPLIELMKKELSNYDFYEKIDEEIEKKP